MIKKAKKLCFEINLFWIAKIIAADTESSASSRTNQIKIKSKSCSSQSFILRSLLSLSKSVVSAFIAFEFSKNLKTDSRLRTFRTMRRSVSVIEIFDFFLMTWKSFENLIVDNYLIVSKEIFRLIHHRFRQNSWLLKVLSKIKWKKVKTIMWWNARKNFDRWTSYWRLIDNFEWLKNDHWSKRKRMSSNESHIHFNQI